MKPSRFRWLLQTGAFLRKEVQDVTRHPRLLLTLVLGPFAIMAIFGIGYRDTPEPMSTLFVAPEGSPFLEQIDRFASQLDDYVDYEGTTSDAASAHERLVSGDIDLIVTFPDDPLQSVLAGEQAPITVTHTRLDPVERTAISFASRLGIDQINSSILARVVGEGQDLVTPAGDAVHVASEAVSAADQALAAGDDATAAAALDDLDRAVRRIETLTTMSADLFSQYGVDGAIGESAGGTEATLGDLRSTIDELRTEVDALGSDESRLGRVSELLTDIDERFDAFVTVDPEVLVRPFVSDVDLAVDNVDRVTDWYAPAAVVLMLQQFGVAFGALSFVRERQLGIVDVYRVAPVKAPQALAGKYLAYLLVGGVIAAVLTALVVLLLDVPLAGSLGSLALVMGLTLFASIGLGFVISLASPTDTQAVQYTMVVLLASLFFSGFFLAIGQLEGVARAISWLLPSTYGMKLLRDVMLRGAELDSFHVAGLAGFGVAMAALTALGARRRMAPTIG